MRGEVELWRRQNSERLFLSVDVYWCVVSTCNTAVTEDEKIWGVESAARIGSCVLPRESRMVDK